ncbi:MAG: sulfite exporter TauE/SafE family protein [Cyanobacteria bacterium P01_G01_bin.54]
MLHYWLIGTVGFLGSFGHCLGMCGPIALAFSLNPSQPERQTASQQFRFHLWLNLGRIVSYAFVGGAIGAIGSVLVASGQVAGVGSGLRRGLTITTGLLLVWFGLVQINPRLLPPIPLLNPVASGSLHERLNHLMVRLGGQRSPATPFLLGLVWGLIPCGFLYAAQLRAAETADLWQGSLTMVAFGLGTLPTMLGLGWLTTRLTGDRRSQLFRLGGWLTLAIGLLLLLRTGDAMQDYSGHGALGCLILALLARPLSRVWAAPLRYRRLLGVGAFVLALMHGLQMLEHAWGWRWVAVQFMVPRQQLGIVWGAIALTLMTPAALTSFNTAQRSLGRYWRKLHLLAVPALVFATGHIVLVGSSYWGNLSGTSLHHTRSVMLMGLVGSVLVLRSRWVWSWFSLEQYYANPPSTPSLSFSTSKPSQPCCDPADPLARSGPPS